MSKSIWLQLKKQFENGMVDGWKSIILESDDEVATLPNTTTIPSIDGLATEQYVNDAVANIVLTSEGGKKFKLTVTDDDTLTAVEVTE